METQVKYRLVGAFVLFLSVGLVAALLWLSEINSNGAADYYTVYFRQQSLAGLQKDSYVTMKGIKIGNVLDYKVSPRNIEEVRVTLRLDSGTPVRDNTTAVIQRNLLTGLATVELMGSTQDGQELRTAPHGESYPVIPEGLSPLAKITDSIPQLLEQLSGAVNRLQAFMSDENIASFQKTLNNLEEASSSVAQQSKSLESTLQAVESAAKGVSSMSKSVETLTSSHNKEISRLLTNANSVMENVGATVAEVKVQSASVGESISSAARVFNQEISTLSQSISEAAESVAKTVEGFEDPRSIITGPRERSLGPGEKITK